MIGNGASATTEAAAFEVRSKRGFWLPRCLGAVAFAVACLVGMRSGPWFVGVLGAVGAVLFASLAVYGLRQGLRTGPRLVLAREGVDIADVGVGVIPWTDIEGMETFGSAEAPFIAFYVPDAAPWVARMPAWPRLVRRLLAAQGLPSFSVNLIGVDREVAEIARRARALHAAAVP